MGTKSSVYNMFALKLKRKLAEFLYA